MFIGVVFSQFSLVNSKGQGAEIVVVKSGKIINLSSLELIPTTTGTGTEFCVLFNSLFEAALHIHTGQHGLSLSLFLIRVLNGWTSEARF